MASQKKTAGDSGQSGFQNLIDSSKQSFEEPAGGIQQPVLFDSAEAERKSGNKNLGTAETTGSNRPAFQPRCAIYEALHTLTRAFNAASTRQATE